MIAVKTKAATPDEPRHEVLISAPNIAEVHLRIVGTAPYVQSRFTAKAMQAIHDTQEAGSVTPTTRSLPPRIRPSIAP